MDLARGCGAQGTEHGAASAIARGAAQGAQHRERSIHATCGVPGRCPCPRSAARCEPNMAAPRSAAKEKMRSTTAIFFSLIATPLLRQSLSVTGYPVCRCRATLVAVASASPVHQVQDGRQIRPRDRVRAVGGGGMPPRHGGHDDHLHAALPPGTGTSTVSSRPRPRACPDPFVSLSVPRI